MLCLMTLKNDAKFEEKIIYCFKNNKNLLNFDLSTRNSQNFHFDWFFLCKVYNVWPKNVQRNDLSWDWRVMQNLKKNWLVVWKITWRIWQIFTWTLKSLENLHFNGILLTKVYIVWAKKSTEEISFMTLKSEIWRKLTCGLENDIRNSANFHQSTRKSQYWYFGGILLSKVDNVWA